MADKTSVGKLIQDATHKMDGRKRIDDFHDLCVVAMGAIAKALDDGNGKHPPGSWMDEDVAEQMLHMEAHYSAFANEPPGTEDHLAHLICRAVIARALVERG